nr:GNAT family N-acetyltransferase [Streptomyces sp. NA04227]
MYARCATATPFQSHAWLHSWWLSYGRTGRLRVALVWEGTRLRAAAALMAVPFPVPSLVLLGGGVSDFKDVLVDDVCREPAARLLADGLAKAARTRLVDLGEVRPGAAAELLHAVWRGPHRALEDSRCLHLPALPMDALLARLARPRAQRFRAKLRRIETLGVRRRTVSPARAGEAVRTLLRLHRLQWQGRGVTPEHLEPRFAAHLERAAEAMVRTGQARLTEFRLGEEVLAVDLTLLAPRLRGGYLYGAHPRLRDQKVDVAAMLLSAAVSDLEEVAGGGERGAGAGKRGGSGAGRRGSGGAEADDRTPNAAERTGAAGAPGPDSTDRAAASDDRTTRAGDRTSHADDRGADGTKGSTLPNEPGILSLLRGNEPYKHHWRPEATTNRRLLLASRTTAPLLGAVVLDLAARQRAKAVRKWWRQRAGADPTAVAKPATTDASAPASTPAPAPASGDQRQGPA